MKCQTCQNTATFYNPAIEIHLCDNCLKAIDARVGDLAAVPKTVNLEGLLKYAKTGMQWELNSSLELWFPITAERLARLEADYEELVMAVARKFPGETRHMTALRYIKEAEERAGKGEDQAAQ